MKTIKMNQKKWGVTIIVFLILQSSFAQELLDSLSQDESKIVSAIAPYAPDMRAAILSVSQYPQALVKIERTQAHTSQSFQDLISGYPRAEQEKFYQASRFPELTNKLADLGKRNIEEVKPMVSNYPEGVQQPMLDVYRDHFDALVKINSLYRSSQNTLKKITAKYTPQIQEDFRKVIENPDVMSLLTDNIDLTVSLGESYMADPKGVTRYLDNLSTQLAEQNSKDLDAYKNAVETDPKLQAEMKKAADEFARQYDQPDTNLTNVTNGNYYGSAPYPYWFGYPYWYGSPMWYPSPFYYNTGFYYGLNGGVVVTGLPSFAYANWFFGHGYSRYPGLYHHYNTYYNIHRAHITHVNVYHGFNTATHHHFNNTANHGRNGRAGFRSENRSGKISNRSGVSHRNQINSKHENFTHNSFNHPNANSFHRMSWQPMHHGVGMRGRH